MSSTSHLRVARRTVGGCRCCARAPLRCCCCSREKSLRERPRQATRCAAAVRARIGGGCDTRASVRALSPLMTVADRPCSSKGREKETERNRGLFSCLSLSRCTRPVHSLFTNAFALRAPRFQRGFARRITVQAPIFLLQPSPVRFEIVFFAKGVRA